MELMWIPGVCVGGSFLAMIRVLVHTGHKAGLVRIVALLGLAFIIPFLLSASMFVTGLKMAPSFDSLSMVGFIVQLPGAVVATLVSLWIAFKRWPKAVQ